MKSLYANMDTVTCMILGFYCNIILIAICVRFTKSVLTYFTRGHLKLRNVCLINTIQMSALSVGAKSTHSSFHVYFNISINTFPSFSSRVL